MSEMQARDGQVADDGFQDAIERHHRALGEFMHGNTEPYKEFFSGRDDATLANPFGGIARGQHEIWPRLDRAASYYQDGRVMAIETISAYSDGVLGYTVEIERVHARVGGREASEDVAVRTTSVLRREEGVWRLLHRHADPRVELQPAESISA